jgi:hypothetical protein
MNKTELIRVDAETRKELYRLHKLTDVPMGKIVKRKVFGKGAKIKKLGEF